jgi:hypothetical protein
VEEGEMDGQEEGAFTSSFQSLATSVRMASTAEVAGTWAETAFLAACPGAQLVSEAEFSDIYWDMHDFSLLRSVSSA